MAYRAAPVTIEELQARLKAIGEAEGGPMFMGWPDRWWDAHTRRCVNDHVSTMVLRSEELGRDACLACRAPVVLSFPEDRDGPLLDQDPGLGQDVRPAG